MNSDERSQSLEKFKPATEVSGSLRGALKEPTVILRFPKVKARVGKSKSSIYADPTFPKSVAIGKRSVGWIEEEIQNWLSDRIDQSRSKATA